MPKFSKCPLTEMMQDLSIFPMRLVRPDRLRIIEFIGVSAFAEELASKLWDSSLSNVLHLPVTCSPVVSSSLPEVNVISNGYY